MASAYLVLILLFTKFEIITAAQRQREIYFKSISPGCSLSPSRQPSSWNSSSGRFQFGFYKQSTGFSVGIWLVSTFSNITIVWTANRDDPPVSSNSTIILTMDGKLVLKTEGSKDKAIADEFLEPASFASMLDSGNFVLYNNRSQVIWSSFSNPTDTILGGQNLSTGSDLFSSVSETNRSTGRFHLSMQDDGNLVLYPNTDNKDTDAYWASGTNWGTEMEYYLNLSPRGVLQLLSSRTTEQIIASRSHSVESLNETAIYRATLDSDGILRLYSHSFNSTSNSNETIEWSALQNQCEVNGFCGVNSFCNSSTSSDGSGSKTDCYCFPWFDFINPDKQFLGCSRNFSNESCKSKESSKHSNTTEMEITKLGGLPYAKLSASKKDCRKSCLDDCYCGAALYSIGTCRKFKLPLLYAVRDQNQSAKLFVKWSSGSTNLSTPRISSPIPKEKVETDIKKKPITVVAACLGSIMFLCFLIGMSSLLVYKFWVNRNQNLRGNSNLGVTQEFILQSFSYNELEKATNGFQEELGRGSFGAVYRGVISEGNRLIAVKRLENPVVEGERKFQAEMAAVRRTHHKNLVRLLGYCLQSSKKLLVYEFMSRGSLENLLLEGTRPPFWSERVRIALDVARGIFYLHEECEVQIIHCDIKLRNILIDDSWNAKISDFGLAKLLMPNQTGIVAGVRGSRVYMAPEWRNSGLITVKSDVYSFGVVLLKIICCRSNFEVDVSTADEVLLSTCVYNCFVSKELNKLVSKEEEEEVDMKTLEAMVKVGLLCIQDDPSLRPSMKNVIFMLEGTMDIPVPLLQTPLLIA